MSRYLLIVGLLAATACASAVPVVPEATESVAPAPIADAAGVAAAIERRDRAALGEAARSPDASLRAAAVRGIGSLQDPADARAVRLALRDDAPGVRLAAARAAGLLGASTAPFDTAERGALGDTVAGVLASEQDPAIRQALLWALARIGGPLRPLFLAIVDDDPAIRTEALLGVGLVVAQDAPADPSITRAAIADAAAAHARDPAPEVRAAVAWLLGELRYPASEEWLAALTRDEDAHVRAAATRALGAVATEPSLLEALLGDTAAQVRVEAARALLVAGARMGHAGVKGSADLTREEAFARSIGRSAEALTLELGTDAEALALHPLLLLARGSCAAPAARPVWCGRVAHEGEVRPGALPASAAARARRALDGYAADSRVARAAKRRQGAVEADVVLHTSRGTVHIVLDDEGAPLASARLRARVAQGAWDGAAVAHLEPGALLHVGPQNEADAALPTENAEAPWLRGTVGTTLDGRAAGLLVSFARQPRLEGRATPVGRVIAGMDVLDAVLPGDVIVRAVLH